MRNESRASPLDMRRAMDQTARLCARAAAEPEALAEELVDLFRHVNGGWGVLPLSATAT